MLRRLFRFGLRSGILVGIGSAVWKAVQSRRAGAIAPSPEPWAPIEQEPVPGRADEPVTAPAAADAASPAAEPPEAEVQLAGLEPVVPPVDEVGEPILEPPVVEPGPNAPAPRKPTTK